MFMSHEICFFLFNNLWEAQLGSLALKIYPQLQSPTCFFSLQGPIAVRMAKLAINQGMEVSHGRSAVQWTGMSACHVVEHEHQLVYYVL